MERADAGRALENLLLPLLEDLHQFRAGDVLDAASDEFIGPLERRALFELIGLVPLKIGIAPRGTRRDVRPRRLQRPLRRRLPGAQCSDRRGARYRRRKRAQREEACVHTDY